MQSQIQRQRQRQRPDPRIHKYKREIEYINQRTEAQIFQTITDNFVFVSHIDQKQGEIKGQTPFKNQKGEPISLRLSLAACRYVRKNEQTDKLEMLIYQQQDIEETRNIELKDQNSTSFYSEQQQINLISKYWEDILQIVNSCINENKSFSRQLQHQQILQIGIFRREQNQSSNQKIKYYALIRLRRSKRQIGQERKNAKYSQNNIIICLFSRNQIQEIQTTSNSPPSSKENVPKYELLRQKNNSFLLKVNINFQTKKQTIKNGVKFRNMTVNFTIEDCDNLFNELVLLDQASSRKRRLFPDQISTMSLNEINQIDCTFKEYNFRRKKRIFKKHYFLAFQGGGAKGIAYLGAVRALQQSTYKTANGKEEKIEIRGLIGSSAGGMIAFAVSTGIPINQIENISSQMSKVTQTSHNTQQNGGTCTKVKDTHQDDFKQSINWQRTVQNIRSLLSQYGILHEQTFDSLREILIKNPEFQEKIITYLQLKLPSVGKLLKVYKRRYIESGCWSRLKALIKKKCSCCCCESCKEEKKSKDIKMINFKSIILEGAFLEGQKLEEIAAECLIKFLLKCFYLYDDLSKRLTECLFHKKEANFAIEKEEQDSKLIQHLINHIANSANLMNVPIRQQQKISQLLVTLVNKWLIILQTFVNERQNSIDNSLDLSTIILQDNILGGVLRCTLAQKNNLAQIFEEKLGNELNNIQFRLNNRNTYKEIRALAANKGLVNLLNHEQFQFTKSQKHQNFTFEKFFRLIFQPVLVRYKIDLSFTDSKQFRKIRSMQDRKRQMRKYFLILELQRAIKEVCQLFQFACSSEYQSNVESLKELAKKITLRQYYKLTSIELTFTAVDLNDKILRFLNHKTTPKLPVAKAVQITGSFPFVFKAVRWQRQWGYYHVYLNNRLVKIDVTGHQFTDGGMLANFPIKYLDNNDLRKKYFSHQRHEKQTILIGFGFDVQKSHEYSQTEYEVQRRVKNENLFQQAWSQLTEYLPSKSSMLCSLCRLTVGSNSQLAWWKIEHSLLFKIPLFRFAYKFINAYPNADRNLNVEAFKNRIVIENDDSSIDQDSQDLFANVEMKMHEAHQFFILYEQFADKLFRPSAIYENQIDVQNQINITQRINNWTILFKASILELNRNLTQYFPPFRQYTDAQMQEKIKLKSRKLICIFMLYLQDEDNKKIAQKLTKRYAYLKYVKPINKATLENNSKNSQIDKQMGQQIYDNLHQSGNYQHIYLNGEEKTFKQIYFQQINKKIHSKNIKNDSMQVDDDDRMALYTQVREKLKKKNSNQVDWEIYDLRLSQKRVIQFILLDSEYQRFKDDNNMSLRLSEINQHIKENSSESLLHEEETIGINFAGIVRAIIRYVRREKIIVSPLFNYYLSAYSQQMRQQLRIFNTTEQQMLARLYAMKNYKIKSMSDIMSGRINLSHQIIWKNEEQLRQLLREQAKINLTQQDQPRQQSVTLLNLTNLQFKNKNQRIRNLINQIKFSLREITSTRITQSQPRFFQNLVNFYLLKQDKIRRRLQFLEFSPSMQQKYIIQWKQKQNSILDFSILKDEEKKFSTLQASIIENLEINAPNTQINDINIDRFQMEEEILIYLEVETAKQQIKKLSSACEEKITEFQNFLKNVRKIRILFEKMTLQDIKIEKEHQKQKGIFKLIWKEPEDIEYDEIKAVFTTVGQILLKFESRYQSYKDKLIKFVTDGNRIDENAINQLFIISFSDLYNLAYVFKFLLPQFQSSNNSKYLQLILKISDDLINHHYKIPFLKSQWQLALKAVQPLFQKSLLQIVLHQNISKSKNFLENLNQKQKELRSKQREKDELQFQLQILQWKKKQSPYKYLNFNIHLVLQSLQNAFQFYPAYCQFLEQLICSTLLQHKKKEPDCKVLIDKYRDFKWIKAITCSNYHSIFAFLLMLGKDMNQIRKEMCKVKSYTTTTEKISQQKHDDKFKQFVWTENVPNRYKQFLKLISQDNENYFDRLNELNQQKSNSFLIDYQNLRALYDNERQKIYQTYENIINQTSQFIGNLSSAGEDYMPARLQAIEISKRYALDYECEFNEKHEHSPHSYHQIQLFKSLVNNLYRDFGSLMEAIISNKLMDSSPIKITQENACIIAKGIIMNKLFTVYKLKKYVKTHLRQAGLTSTITLREFTQSVKRELVLNISVINVYERRLQFLNASTMPNIPVWAAIVASASLPFFHDFFVANKEWEFNLKQSMTSLFFHPPSKTIRRQTLYTSANYISSLPLELLTNNIFLEEVNKKIPFPFYSLKHFAFALDKRLFQKMPMFVLNRKMLNITCCDILALLPNYCKCSSKCSQIWRRICCCCGWNKPACNKKIHDNFKYNHQYSLKSFFPTFLSSHFKQTVDTLLGSNDNFIFKWYSSRIIKLPIKLQTLDFHDLINKDIEQKYHIPFLTNKCKEANDRSYQVTKTWITPMAYEPSQYQHLQFRSKIRIQIINAHRTFNGVVDKMFRIQFLNHTRWNLNNLSTYVVEYKVAKDKNKKLIRANNSQILWNLNDGMQIFLIFYYTYLEKPKDNEQMFVIGRMLSISRKIMYTSVLLNLQRSLECLLQGNSHDYQLCFGKGNGNLQFVPQLLTIKTNQESVVHEDCRIPLRFNEPAIFQIVNKSQNQLIKFKQTQLQRP